MFDIIAQADDANWMTMRYKFVICIKYHYTEFFLPGTMIVAWGPEGYGTTKPHLYLTKQSSYNLQPALATSEVFGKK